jgi:hypothetical protein
VPRELGFSSAFLEVQKYQQGIMTTLCFSNKSTNTHYSFSSSHMNHQLPEKKKKRNIRIIKWHASAVFNGGHTEMNIN